MSNRNTTMGNVEQEDALLALTDAEMDQLLRACWRWKQQGKPLEDDPAVQRFLELTTNPKLALLRLRMFLEVGAEATRPERETAKP